MKQTKIITLAAISLSLVVAVGSAVLLDQYNSSLRFTLAIATMAALFSLVAVPLFLSGLKHFKTGLRRAYIILCVGIALFGLAQVQIPLISLLGAYFWIDSGPAAFVYLFGSVGIFWGVRSFAKLLHIESIWTSALLCTAVIALAAAPMVFVPHVETHVEESQYDALVVLVVVNMIIVGFAAAMTTHIKRIISPSYGRSIAWLSAALWEIVFAGLHFLVVRLLLTDGDWYFDYSLSILPFTIGALMFIKAGYEFNAIVSADQSNEKVSDEPKSSLVNLDIITYVASLASTPKGIDLILDDFRQFTVRLRPGDVLTDAQKDLLVSIYQRLENYLITQEALRAFTRAEIRQLVLKKFGPNEIITAVTEEAPAGVDQGVPHPAIV